MSVRPVPMNQQLYDALTSINRGKLPLIANAGYRMSSASHFNVAKNRNEEAIASFGETYRINCPYCHETRSRLYVNYRYGTVDPVTNRIIDNWCRCFNEECMQSRERKRDLYNSLFAFQNRRGCKGGFAVNLQDEPAAVTPRVPGRLGMIADHPAAAQYLLNRRIGPAEWERYGLRYVIEPDPDYYDARNTGGRIYIPIVDSGVYVGWQCRYIEPPGTQRPRHIPKYLTMTGMRKTNFLYNFDAARNYPFVAVFEGAAAVWRAGGPSVALFGKSASPVQKRRLQDTWNARQPLVFVLDPDAQAEADLLHDELGQTNRNPIVTVRIPEGDDIDNYDRTHLWNFIYASASRVGVELPRGVV